MASSRTKKIMELSYTKTPRSSQTTESPAPTLFSEVEDVLSNILSDTLSDVESADNVQELFLDSTDDPSFLADNDKDLSNNSDESTSASTSNNIDTQDCVGMNFDSQSTNTNTRKRRPGLSKINIAQDNKKKRLTGKAYLGRKKSAFDQKRKSREMKPSCQCKSSKAIKPTYFCAQFSEERRQEIYVNFWNLSTWKERKVYVAGKIDTKDVKERKSNANNSRRSASLFYHFDLDNNNARVKVCKTFFLNTLCIGEWSARSWALEENYQSDVDTPTTSKKHTMNPIRKKFFDNRDSVREFLAALPKLESHYCRKSTNKLYLEQQWQSQAHLYREYQNYCSEKDQVLVSRQVFKQVFTEENIGLFSPKKDACDTCCSYNAGNLEEAEYQAHLKKKDEARQQKEWDKTNTTDDVDVYTMDLQAVLLAPKLNASALYYRTKLKIHNFTIYNLKTADAFCYLWNESEGGLNADEFSTIVYNFIITKAPGKKEIILYSDGCTYQNRNSIVANTLLLASKKTGVIITQKYLEKGHTQMECDSMHSTIERKLRNREIYAPSGYYEVCKTARMSPKPFEVIELDHTFFKKYSVLKAVTSLRPGTKTGDPTVTDIRVIQYFPDWKIQVKLFYHSACFEELPRRMKKIQIEEVPPLYNQRLKIKNTKFKHLQELKSVIPKDFHPFYDSLPH